MRGKKPVQFLEYNEDSRTEFISRFNGKKKKAEKTKTAKGKAGVPGKPNSKKKSNPNAEKLREMVDKIERINSKQEQEIIEQEDKELKTTITITSIE
jgi:hypothetical protein